MQSDSAKQMTFDFTIKPYIDPNGWMRILSRQNMNIKLDFKGMLQPQDFQSRFRFRDFGVSDNEETMNTENSWYFQNVQLQPLIVNNLPGYPPTYLNQELVNKNRVIANVFNGKTPTGTQWTQSFNEGYLVFSGVVKTYGSWDKYWMGWTNDPYVKIGTKTSLRSGGAVHHTGEFIHSSCNGYKDIDHSITSRVDWKNKRVFWIKL